MMTESLRDTLMRLHLLMIAKEGIDFVVDAAGQDVMKHDAEPSIYTFSRPTNAQLRSLSVVSLS